MPDFGVAVSWMILSPIAFLTNLALVLVVLHYRPLFHSCDVAMTSLLVTMATNALLLVPIQAVMELGDFYWSDRLCTFFVWLSVTLRSSNVLALLAASVYWMASLRVTVKGHMFTSSKYMKLSVCVCWLISVVAGLIPATGGTDMFHYYADDSCRFLPSNISVGFALVFIVAPLLTFTMGVISTADSFALFRRMKDVALIRHDAGGFSLPTASAGAAPASSVVHAKYSELNVSADLCRLVLAFTLASTGINGLPLMVSQFVQLIQDHDRVVMETVLLWLLLLESLFLPHLLWLLSDRYRHAAVYTWKVFVLRDKTATEEDAAACTLQAYRFKERVLYARPYMNGSGVPKANGTAVRPTSDRHSTGATPQPSEHIASSRSNGVSGGGHESHHRGRDHDIMTTDLDDGMTALTQLTSAKPVDLQTAAESQPHPNGRVVTIEAGVKVPPRKYPRVSTNGVSKAPTSPPPPLPPTTLQTLAVPEQQSHNDVKRSASSSSRQEWKDTMRKKYLPAVLLDDSSDVHSPGSVPGNSVDTEDYHESAVRATRINQLPNTASIESSYYISSDYHYEYLSDLGPPPLQQQWTCDSEGGAYGSCDIVDVLDESDVHEGGIQSSEVRPGANNKTNGIVVSFVQGGSSHLTGSDIKEGLVDKEIITRPPRTAPAPSRNTALVSIPAQNDTYMHQPNVLGVQFKDSDTVTTSGVISVEALRGTTPPLKPVIRRDNYRKFLPYTNLVVSSVDVEDNNLDGDTAGPEVSSIDVTDSTTTSQWAQASEASLPNGTKSLFSSDSLSTDGTSMLSHEESDSERVVNEDEPSDDDRPSHEAKTVVAQQDYGGLETVSGSEMLRLKMSSVRRAIAMDSTDDSTNSDSDPETDKSTSTDTALDLPADGNRVVYPTGSRSYEYPDDGECSPDITAVSADEKSIRIVIGTESEDNETKNVKERPFLSAGVKPKPQVRSKRQNDQILTTKTSSPVNTTNPFPKSPPQSREARQSEIITNPFLRESFETASQKHQVRSNSNPFLNTADIFIGAEAVSVDVFPERSTPVSTTKPGGHSIVKPPRNRENSLKKKSARHTSSEDELDSILNGEEGINNNSFTDSTASSPTQSSSSGFGARTRAQHATDTADDSDSVASDKSVVLEPYGERRPAWMEDPLIASHGTVFLKDQLNTESDTDGFEDAFAPSTFRVTVSDDASDEVLEYDFDAVNIGGVVDYANNRSLHYIRPPASLVHYQFDDETDRGFEDALSYNNHHNYGGLGLCFEAIQEETEESLSESLASLDGNDLSGSTNIFKTQAIVSRPPSRAGVFSPQLKEHPGGDQQQDFLSEDLQDNTESFPIFERTSADGSEEILPSHNGHGSKTPPRKVHDPWGFPDKGGNHPLIDNQIGFLPQVHGVFMDDGEKDIETADDIVTALAFNPDHRGQGVQSPWSDVDGKDQPLDMSFDSDFSHEATDTDSKIHTSPFDDAFGSSFPVSSQHTNIASAYF